ncbi:MAG: multidrug resistance efflux pump [Eubacterium sp.]|jgi:multidrug resistance efflux pump|nr:multidrug resistance efflux pump [Eubacterium sp.]
MRRILIVAMAFIVLTMTITACENQDKAVVVNANAVEQKDKVSAYGTVAIRDVKNINITFPAIIKEVLAQEGEKLKKGSVLINLDMEEYLSQVKCKKLELDGAKIDLKMLKETVQSEMLDVQQTQNEISIKQKNLNSGSDPQISKLNVDIKNAEGIYDKAKRDLVKNQSLYDDNAISKDELEEFSKSVDTKKQTVEDLKYNLEEYKLNRQFEIDRLRVALEQKNSKLSSASESGESDRIKSQQNKIAILESQYDEMNRNLNKSYLSGDTIICDIENAVVSEIGYKRGDYINQAQKVLSLYNVDNMFIEANVNEEFIKDVKLDADVEIIPISDNSKTYKGKVTRIFNKTVQKNGGTDVIVEISIDNKDDALIMGANVDLLIDK